MIMCRLHVNDVICIFWVLIFSVPLTESPPRLPVRYFSELHGGLT